MTVRHGDSKPVARAVYLADDDVEQLCRGLGLSPRTAAAVRITDSAGQVVFTVVFPGWRGRAVIVVRDGAGREVGRAVKTKDFLRPRHALWSGKERAGAVRVLDRRQRTTRVTDEAGTEVATIIRTLGQGGYSLQVFPPLEEPLRGLVVATAVVLQAAIGSETGVDETEVLPMSLIPPFLDPLPRGYYS